MRMCAAVVRNAPGLHTDEIRPKDRAIIPGTRSVNSTKVRVLVPFHSIHPRGSPDHAGTPRITMDRPDKSSFVREKVAVGRLRTLRSGAPHRRVRASAWQGAAQVRWMARPHMLQAAQSRPKAVKPSRSLVKSRGSIRSSIDPSAALERHKELEKLDRLKARIRATSYGLGGMDWNAVFRRYDADHSGELDADEFVAALKTVASSACLNEDDLRQLFEQVDIDGSGLVDAAEFTAFMEITPDERARKQIRDSNGHGTQEYIVMAPCILREQADMSSEKLGHLSKGEVVAVTDRRGNRLRISRLKFGSLSQPQTGWVSETAMANSDDASDGEDAPRILLAKLERAEGQMGRFATERELAEGTQRRLMMLAKDKMWADYARKESAAARRQRRRPANTSRQPGYDATTGAESRRHASIDSRCPQPNAPEESSGGRNSIGLMSEAEHQLYGEIAAAALAECDVASGSRRHLSPEASDATRMLLLSLLEHTPRWQWGRAVEREWPVLKQELLTLLAVSESGNSAAAEEAVACAMLRWRQERAASCALRGGKRVEPEHYLQQYLSQRQHRRTLSSRATAATRRVLAPLDASSSSNAAAIDSTGTVSVETSICKGALFSSDAVSIGGSESDLSTDAGSKYASVDRVIRRRRRLAERERGKASDAEKNSSATLA